MSKHSVSGAIISMPIPTTTATPLAGALTQTGNKTLTLEQVPQPLAFYQNPASLLPVLAFIGVILTIFFGWKKMKVELAASATQAQRERDQSRDEASLDRQHHADQAHQERISKARREVYLELISEMTKSQSTISLLPTQDASKLDIHSGFSGLITAVAKISILGEMGTLIKSRELLTLIHETMFRVIVKLIPIDALKESRREHESRRDQHKLEIERLTEVVDSFERKRVNSLDSLDANNQLRYHREKFIEHSDLAIQSIKEFSVAHRGYMQEVMKENKAINFKVDEVIFLIRNELALSTSLEELHRSTLAQHAAAQASTENLYATVEIG